MVDRLTQEEISEFKEAFDEYSDNGTLTTKEVPLVIKSLKPEIPESELKDMITEVNLCTGGGTGVIGHVLKKGHIY